MSSINDLLSQLNIHPVLVDVGASGTTPEIWEPIARDSIYVGFDPDLREIREVSGDRFHKSIVINEAIAETEGISEGFFYLTKSPYCSSILKPDSESLSNFIFSDLFSVEDRVKTGLTTLNSVIDRFSLTQLDWLKTDSQGTDLRIFNSLKNEIRSRVLAIDIEPGLIDAYQGEDLFVDAHKSIVEQGFWLSNLKVCGTVRMKLSTLDRLGEFDRSITRELMSIYHKYSPGWCEARYLRTIQSLSENNVAKRDYVLLWVFSLLDEQLGFALEVAWEYEKVFGKDKLSQTMVDEIILRIEKLTAKRRGLKKLVGKFIPNPIKQWIKNL